MQEEWHGMTRRVNRRAAAGLGQGREFEPASEGPLIDELRRAALPLGRPRDLDPLLCAIGDAHYVLLGEASHGTSEYYNWRTILSRRLITEKGFSLIAVEGDWPDCYRVNRFVKGRGDPGEAARDVLHAFARWPTWIWANHEVVELIEWLAEHNRGRPEQQRAGFYGLDVYALWDSRYQVIAWLRSNHPDQMNAPPPPFQPFPPSRQHTPQH